MVMVDYVGGLPTLLVRDGIQPSAELRRSRSEAALGKAVGRQKPATAAAELNSLMSRRTLSSLDPIAKKSDDEERIDALKASVQKHRSRPSSTPALDKAVGGKKPVGIKLNPLMSPPTLGNAEEIQEIQAMKSSLSQSQTHFFRPSSTSSLLPTDPISSGMASLQSRRNKYLASLNQVAWPEIAGVSKAIQRSIQRAERKEQKLNQRGSPTRKSNSPKGKSKLQHRRSLTRVQVREQLLSCSAEDVRCSTAQNTNAQTSQVEQKFPSSDDQGDDSCEEALGRNEKERSQHKKTMSTIKEPARSKHAEIKHKQEKASEALDPFQVSRVSKQLNCPLATTKDAQGLFDLYAIYDQGRGQLDYQKFGEIVVQIMKSTGQQLSEGDMKNKIESSFRQADRNKNGMVDFDEFAIWYSSWGFQQELLLSPQQILVRDFAKKYGLSIADVESVQAKFNLFDLDGSGVIEYDEFEKLLYKLMKVPRGQELPASRLKHFWKEIDIDGSGGIDFDEFLQWYMKYFDMKGNSDFTPVEQLYQSVRPNLGRY